MTNSSELINHSDIPVTIQTTKNCPFQPFSAGRRSCMGYKMVEMVVVSLLASLTANFTFSCDQAHLDHQAGMLALPM